MSIIQNTLKTKLTLKKKCSAIAYHAICKSVAMGESLRGRLRSDNNQADLLTKVVTGQKRIHLLSLVLYYKYDENT